MKPYKKTSSKSSGTKRTAIISIAGVVICVCFLVKYASSHHEALPATDQAPSNPSAITLSDAQLKAVKIETATKRDFIMTREATGSVSYREKESGMQDKQASNAIKFMVANIPESDSPLIRAGQPVEATFDVYPGRSWKGKITVVGVTVYDSGGNPAIDPITHRITARCEIDDPKDELYPGMLATLRIQVENPAQSVAIPQNGVVREGDGTMVVWVAEDDHHFTPRTVKIGLQQDGYDQVLEGLHAGEHVATDGALFMDNALAETAQ